MTSSSQHTVAILPDKETHSFVLEQHPTPTPGPDDILVEVRALAMNPIDVKQRDTGWPVLNYPGVIGGDIGGVVVATGSNVPSSFPQPGTRIAAWAPSYYEKGKIEYGAFQQYACVWKEKVTAIPDHMSFAEASMVPVALYTAWHAFYTLGMPLGKSVQGKEALLIWGGGSSVGMATIQVARSLGFTSYVTASPKHNDYLKSLGASKLFDYKDPDVVQQIVKVARDDGFSLTKAIDAAGGTRDCLDVLKEFKGAESPVLASAPSSIFSPTSPTEPGVKIRFVKCPDDAVERRAHMEWIGQVWLKEKLASGEYVPSGKMELFPERGLEALDRAVDKLKAGVSGTKIVLEL